MQRQQKQEADQVWDSVCTAPRVDFSEGRPRTDNNINDVLSKVESPVSGGHGPQLVGRLDVIDFDSLVYGFEKYENYGTSLATINLFPDQVYCFPSAGDPFQGKFPS